MTVLSLDILEYDACCLLFVCEHVLIDTLRFKRFKEALSYSVVSAIPFQDHTYKLNPQILTKSDEEPLSLKYAINWITEKWILVDFIYPFTKSLVNRNVVKLIGIHKKSVNCF